MKHAVYTRNVQPAVYNPVTGAPSNHHHLPDGSLGERVKPSEAECMIVTVTTVIDLRKSRDDGYPHTVYSE